MKNDFFVRAQPRVTLLEESQKEEIHRSSLRLLQRNGIIVHEPQALKLLEAAGCGIEGKRVFIPETVVQRAIATVPETIEIYDRRGAPAAHSATGREWDQWATTEHDPLRHNPCLAFLRDGEEPRQARCL